MLKVIDPHIHLFALKDGQYGWLRPQNPPFWPDKHKIHRDYTESDLCLALSGEQSNTSIAAHIGGYVHIEAGFNNQQPCAEIAWLQANCKRPFRSIAGVDITSEPAYFHEQVGSLNAFASVVGLRHILDDQAEQILQHPATLTNLCVLAKNNYLFELQMPLQNKKAIDALSAVLEGVPELQVVVNHAGSPPYILHEDATPNELASTQAWDDGMKALAAYSQVSIKLSGWEMGCRAYALPYLERISLAVLAHFGHERVMLASNFPLCELSLPYAKYWQMILSQAWFVALPEAQKKALCADNASRVYRFP